MSKTTIAVVIPAHNEAATIGACLTSVQTAIAQLPAGVRAHTVVVLDSCTDDTASIAQNMGADILTCDYKCVGQTRDLGVRHAISTGASWLACTDADSIVPKDWLVAQVDHMTQTPVDMICGVVSVDSFQGLSEQTKSAYIAHYQDKMDHRHIHGANLSFSASAYLAVGGFSPLPCHEDVDLVKRFEASGYTIIWSNRVRVITSSRLQARASEGFAAFLSALEQEHCQQ